MADKIPSTIAISSDSGIEIAVMTVERTDSSVVITGVDEVITWVNPAFTELTGYSAQEAIGRRPGELLQGPASDPRVRAVLRDRLRQGLEVAVCQFPRDALYRAETYAA